MDWTCGTCGASAEQEEETAEEKEETAVGTSLAVSRLTCFEPGTLREIFRIHQYDIIYIYLCYAMLYYIILYCIILYYINLYYIVILLSQVWQA